MATAEGYVEPKPGIPKTLGILNIIFGTLLVLGGGCFLMFFLATPTLMTFAEKTAKDQQATKAKINEAARKSLDEREKTETSDEQKAAIAAERQAITDSEKVPMVDLGFVSELYKNPLVLGYNLTYFGTGLLLHLLLLISGILLVRTVPSGRTLALAWAGLQVVQLVAFLAINTIYVEPKLKPTVDRMVADLEAKAQAGDAAPQVVQQLQMVRAMEQSQTKTITGIAFALVGSIYPIIVLILLNSAGAKAALLRQKFRPEIDL